MSKSIVRNSVEIENFEIENLENRHYVRVIEDGVVSVKAFESETDATSFAISEKARLGLPASQTR